jgi:hypothetical protein
MGISKVAKIAGARSLEVYLQNTPTPRKRITVINIVLPGAPTSEIYFWRALSACSGFLC